MATPLPRDKLAKLMLRWYSKNRCEYPWRYTKDPFLVLVSEFLLQQTKSNDAVEPYRALVGRYRNASELAQADISFLKDVFGKLGLFYRAERLISAAKFIISECQGAVPHSVEKLLRIPGVGPYSANAVLCFGFGRKVAVVDTNVIRIYSRVYQLKVTTSRARQDRGVWEFARSILPNTRFADFNYALLDFGKTICTSRNPKCGICPLQKGCLYRSSSTSC